ncbi:MAG: LysR family transcriptional regulator [Betaproteobacteria bacterium]
MDLLNRMRLFVRAVEAGSFSAVARESGITQPTVSRQIARLESELGAQLLTRGVTGLRLNDDGESFYARAKQLVGELDELSAGLRSLRGRVTGTLRVNCPASFGETWLTPVLVRLADANPQLDIDLVLSDRLLDLLEERIDVAIRFGPLPDSRLVARRIGTSPQGCFAAPAYLAAHGEPRHPRDLANHRCIVNSFVSYRDHWHFVGPDGELSVPVHGNFRANNLRAIREAVLAGNGVAIGPVWLYFDDLKSGRVRNLMQSLAPAALDIHALYAPSNHLPQRIRHFIEALEGAFRGTPGLADSPSGRQPARRKRRSR